MVTVVGMGPGGEDFVSPAARAAIAAADKVIGSLRWRPIVAALGRELIDYAPLERTIGILETRGKTENIAVVVSGDPGLFSLLGVIKRELPETECRVVPAVSAPQALFAKLGVDWAGVDIVNLHGRNERIGKNGDTLGEPNIDGDTLGKPNTPRCPQLDANIRPGARLCVLTDEVNTATRICARLMAIGAAGRAVVGTNLTMDTERILDMTIAELGEGPPAVTPAPARSLDRPLAILYLEIEHA